MPERPGLDRRLFDPWSLFYDAPPLQWTAYRPVHQAVIRALRNEEPSRILDIGCGTGNLATRLRRELAVCEVVVGCDFSSGMLGKAREHDAAGPWVRGDALCLPFRPGSFDAVVSTEAFHWFPDQREAAAEFHRVLAPGGSLLLGLVSPPLETVSRAAELGASLLGEPLRWPTPAGMRRLVESVGFRVDRQTRLFRPPYLFSPVLTVARVPRGSRPRR